MNQIGTIVNIMNNIKHIRKNKNMTQFDISKLTGISRVQIMRLENGTRRLNQDNINKISKALNCKPEDLISNAYIENRNNQNFNYKQIDDIASVKLYNKIYSESSEGKTIQTFDVPSSELYINKKIIKEISNSEPSNLISLQYFGTSMKPKIGYGDYIFIDITENEVIEDGIYAFYYNNEFYISDIQKLPSKYKIIPHNHLHDPWYIELTNMMKLKIIGTLKAKISKI